VSGERENSTVLPCPSINQRLKQCKISPSRSPNPLTGFLVYMRTSTDVIRRTVGTPWNAADQLFKLYIRETPRTCLDSLRLHTKASTVLMGVQVGRLQWIVACCCNWMKKNYWWTNERLSVSLPAHLWRKLDHILIWTVISVIKYLNLTLTCINPVSVPCRKRLWIK
jgi:hypothetical protein